VSFSYLTVAELSDVGLRREHNEDCVLSLHAEGVFCVADGMGGAAMGEVASAAAVDELRKGVAGQERRWELKAGVIREALNTASGRIRALSDERGVTGTGTTAVVIYFDAEHPDRAGILHAGDSRAYRFRGHKLEQLTTDHSMAAAAGVKHEKALPTMFRGVVTRAVGLHETVELEATAVSVAAGDVYLLCSDGLNKMVPDKRLQKLLHKAGDADVGVLARQMVEAANSAGGEDNVSVVIIRVSDPLPEAVPGAPPPPEDLFEMAATSETAETSEGGGTPAVTPETPRTPSDQVSQTDEVLIGTTPDTGMTVTTDRDSVQTGEAPAAGDRGGAAPAWLKLAGGLGATAVVLLVLLMLARRSGDEGEPPALVTPPPRPPVVEEPVAPEGTTPDVAPPSEAPDVVVEEPEPPRETTPLVSLVPDVLVRTPPGETGPPAEPRGDDMPEAPVAPAVGTAAEVEADVPSPETSEPVAPVRGPDTLKKLVQIVPTALTEGTWGNVGALAEPWGSDTGELRDQVPGFDNCLVWIAEWRKARDDRGYADRRLAEYADATSTLLSEMNAAGDAAAPLPEAEADAVANAYCKALHGQRKRVVDAAEGLLGDVARELQVLGRNPTVTLAELRWFSGKPPGDSAYAELERNLILLTAWLEDEQAKPVPLMGILHGPAEFIPRVVELRRTLWSDIMDMVGASPSEKVTDLTDSANREALERIGERSASVLRRYEASRRPGATLKWPLEADLKNVERLLADISRMPHGEDVEP